MKLLLLLLAIPMFCFGQNVNIPDANFKAYLVNNTAINTNEDSEIQVSEASVFNGDIYLYAGPGSGFGLKDGITDLTGIEAFVSLTSLNCSWNQLSSLNLSACTALTSLNCRNNYLTSLDVSSCTALTYLVCSGNQLTSLDASNCTALTYLSCNGNQLTSLDVSTCTALISLWSSDNQLTSLDVSTCTALIDLSCSNNQLTSLDVSQNTALTLFICNYNQLTSLDVSQNTALTGFSCINNQLTSLDVRNGNNTNFYFFDSSNNPNLTCINVDDATWSTPYWLYIDSQHYFSNNCSGTGSIQELNTNKKLLKVTDLLGRETKATNQVLIHIYDDGTIEKKIVFE